MLGAIGEKVFYKTRVAGSNRRIYENPSCWEQSENLRKTRVAGSIRGVYENPSCWEQSEVEMFLKNKVLP